MEFEDKSVQECWDIFKSKLEALLVENIPMSNPKDYNVPWINRALMKRWRKKYFAWKRYTENKSCIRYREYKKETDSLKKNTRQAKRLYEKKIVKEARGNKRQFFKYVISNLTVRSEITQCKTKTVN